jgi:hypothetical protein
LPFSFPFSLLLSILSSSASFVLWKPFHLTDPFGIIFAFVVLTFHCAQEVEHQAGHRIAKTEKDAEQSVFG